MQYLQHGLLLSVHGRIIVFCWKSDACWFPGQWCWFFLILHPWYSNCPGGLRHKSIILRLIVWILVLQAWVEQASWFKGDPPLGWMIQIRINVGVWSEHNKSAVLLRRFNGLHLVNVLLAFGDSLAWAAEWSRFIQRKVVFLTLIKLTSYSRG